MWNRSPADSPTSSNPPSAAGGVSSGSDPQAANAAVYEALAERWQAAYAAQLELARAGVTTPMWRAPGG